MISARLRSISDLRARLAAVLMSGLLTSVTTWRSADEGHSAPWPGAGRRRRINLSANLLAVTAAEQTESVDIRDEPDRRRYEVRLDGQLAGFSQYRLEDDRIIFHHTFVDPAFEGGGIGSRLVRHQLDDVRRRGLKVVPLCPFVRSYIKRHAEYGDLLDQAPPPLEQER
jgi:uncharacterized protein